MKKLIIVAMALTMAVIWLPKAYAGEAAQLGLHVTFAPQEPLRLWTKPEGPFKVNNGEELRFMVIAEDLDSRIMELNGENLPPGAEFVILERTDFVPGSRMIGEFIWTPRLEGDGNEYGFRAIFKAANIQGDTAELEVEIRVINSVISIELEGPNPWVLDNVRLGERRSNDIETEIGSPLHKIHNTGNVSVMVDIGYAIMADVLPRPGFAQDLDTYITMVKDMVIPPADRVKIGFIRPAEGMPLPLVYGAPTGLTNNVPGMGAGYEIRAYPMIYKPLTEENQ